MAEAQKPLIRVIGFETTTEKVAKRDEFGEKVLDEKGNMILELKEEHWVSYAPAHAPLSTVNRERIRHIIPQDNFKGDKGGEKARFFRARWAQIEPAYEAWKAGHEIPVNGTPLGRWPAINGNQAEVFRQNGIRTVEEVRDMTASQAERIKLPNVRGLQAEATAFIDNMAGAALAEKEAERDNRIAELEKQLSAALDMLSEKQADDSAERAALRAELDAKGIPYHHKAGVAKLKELLASSQDEAA